MSDIVRQVAVVLCLVVMLWANLAGGGGNPEGDGEPGMYAALPTAFSPAPYTFAVWAPIFLGCIALAVYQALPSMRRDPRFAQLGWLVAAAFVLTALTAYTPIGASNVAITALLVALALAYWEAARAEPQTAAFAWCVRLPLAVFAAWCAVATILNGCQWAVSRGWPVGPVPAAALIGLASLAGVAVVVRRREVAVGVVLVWAFWGIAAARPESSVVVAAAAVATLGLATAAAYARLGRSDSPPVPAS